MNQETREADARDAAVLIDGRIAWLRLGVSLLMGTIGSVGMWSVIVVLPAVQAEFGVARAGASLPYTFTMIGFAIGGVIMGRFADRRGISKSVAVGAIVLAVGYIAASQATSLWQFALAQSVLIGMFGSASCFGPLMTDISHWFSQRRGIAVSICASGNYMAGTIWPPVVQHFVEISGWRTTYLGIGVFCAATMLPLTLLLRRPSPIGQHAPGAPVGASRFAAIDLPPNVLLALLSLAGVACCVAMAMPQVHIVAYCGDLGYGAARGTEMLSLMLGLGVVSRIGSGWIADRIGGLPTLLLGSLLQMTALVLYLGFDGLASLYVISAMFGLFQGGIVPSYAIVVRENFPAHEAGTRFGVVLMATLFGMALGGWMSGAIFDLTGSYEAAFANGVLWNLLNAAIAMALLLRRHRRRFRARVRHSADAPPRAPVRG